MSQPSRGPYLRARNADPSLIPYNPPRGIPRPAPAKIQETEFTDFIHWLLTLAISPVTVPLRIISRTLRSPLTVSLIFRLILLGFLILSSAVFSVLAVGAFWYSWGTGGTVEVEGWLTYGSRELPIPHALVPLPSDLIQEDLRYDVQVEMELVRPPMGAEETGNFMLGVDLRSLRNPKVTVIRASQPSLPPPALQPSQISLPSFPTYLLPPCVLPWPFRSFCPSRLLGNDGRTTSTLRHRRRKGGFASPAKGKDVVLLKKELMEAVLLKPARGGEAVVGAVYVSIGREDAFTGGDDQKSSSWKEVRTTGWVVVRFIPRPTGVRWLLSSHPLPPLLLLPPVSLTLTLTSALFAFLIITYLARSNKSSTKKAQIAPNEPMNQPSTFRFSSTHSSRMSDQIQISDLSVFLPNGLGPSAFGLTTPPPCPILLDISINLHPALIPLVARSDSMSSLGVNYSSVSKAVYAMLSDKTATFNRPEEVMEVAAEVVMGLECVESVYISVKLPKALLHAQEVVYSAEWNRDGAVRRRGCVIRNMKVACVVGLHPHERVERQRLEVDLGVRFGKGAGFEDWDHRSFHDLALSFLEKSSAGTLELLVDQLATHLLPPLPDKSGLDLTIRKPSALPFACPSISISRTKATSRRPTRTSLTETTGSNETDTQGERVFIALGSNIGDRVGNIRRAVDGLEKERVEVVRTGRMYESEPMYVEDQARFINTVIEVSTNLGPLPLLKLLKRIEKSTGRTKTFTNGPRVVDLDLLFYGDGVVKVGEKGDEEDEDGVGWLEVPHWGIAEREFVLRPLNDICPMFIHPTLNLPISVILSRHPSNLVPIIPTPTPLSLDKKNTPLIMAIFNATPDSFSDGSESNLNLTTAIANIRSIFESAHRPDILDIGGMSTRPNSVPCSEEEELKRVVPLIKAIRKEERWKDVVISIDTYRPTVAKAAVEAGANIINDVRGGREEGMMSTMAELGVPVILMHSRGDSTTMTKTESQEYPEGVVRGVQAELGQTVERAIQSGIRSWDIIIDPGIGFAKSQSQSIHLLRHIDEISTLTTGPDDNGGVYPVLVGASRKGFVGKITGREEASERGWGDAVVNAFCVHAGQTTLHGDEEGEGVGILRVHDWRGARESVKMAKAFFAEEE